MLNSYEVITEIKKKLSNVKLIAMTGGSLKLDKKFLVTITTAMRVDKVITKPFDIREVQEIVNGLLKV